MSNCPYTGTPVKDLALDSLTSRKAYFCESFTQRVMAKSCTIAGQIRSSLTLFVNAETGSDANNGLTSETAVATIQTALNLLVNVGQFYGTVVIQLEGTAPHVIGEELNFFPASSFVGSFIIRGQLVNAMDDTVSAVDGFGPNGTYRRVTGTTGGYGSSSYLSKFIWNQTKDEVSVIQDNTSTTIDVINGDTPEDFGPTEPSIAFEVGDEFTLFEAGSDIEFGQRVTIVNPQGNPIQFEYVHLVATSEASQWVNPALPSVTFRGCELDAQHPVAALPESEPCYFGSCNILGCYSENTSYAAYFTDFEQGTCVRSKSFWLNGPEIRYSNECSNLYFYATNSSGSAITTSNAIFTGMSIWIQDGNANRLIDITKASACYIRNLRIESAIQNFDEYLLNIRHSSSLEVQGSCELNQTSAGLRRGCIGLRRRTSLFIHATIVPNSIISISSAGTDTIRAISSSFIQIASSGTDMDSALIENTNSDGTCINLESSLFDIGSTPPAGITISQPNTSSTPTIVVDDNSSFVLSIGALVTFDGNTTSQFGVIYATNNSNVVFGVEGSKTITNVQDQPCFVIDYQSSLVLRGVITLSTSTAAAGTSPIIEIRRGSRGTSDAARSNAGLSPNALQLGDNAVVANPAVTGNDLGAGTPENCFYFSV